MEFTYHTMLPLKVYSSMGFFLVYSQIHATITIVSFRTFSSPQRRNFFLNFKSWGFELWGEFCILYICFLPIYQSCLCYTSEKMCYFTWVLPHKVLILLFCVISYVCKHFLSLMFSTSATSRGECQDCPVQNGSHLKCGKYGEPKLRYASNCCKCKTCSEFEV